MPISKYTNLQKRPLVITMGEPGGVGTDILLKSWESLAESLPPCFVIDDPERLAAACRHLNLSVSLTPISYWDQVASAPTKSLCVMPLSRNLTYKPGQVSAENASAVIESLEKATSIVINHEASGIVTLPIQKDILYGSGFTYPGHTEFLAAKAQCAHSVMMLVIDGLRVIPLTIHQSLKSVFQSLTPERIIETATITLNALKDQFGIEKPRLVISGLNPHAGEGGALGDEELTLINPAISTLQKNGWNVQGPFAADSLFHQDIRKTYDAALCMYHDQALIPLKTLDFMGSVNITLGLPFIRTSPGHGTALHLAGTGSAEIKSFVNALTLAWQLVCHRSS